MKKEIGKWMLDVSKYITTAIVLSTVFGKIDTPLMYIIAGFTILMTFIVGLGCFATKAHWRLIRNMFNRIRN